MKVRKMSVFINMHDSKDAPDFRSLTCHVVRAFEKIFCLFFGILYGGNKSMNFLHFLQNLTHLTMKAMKTMKECFSHQYQLSFKMSYDFNFIWNEMVLSFHYFCKWPSSSAIGEPPLHGFYYFDLCSFTIKMFMSRKRHETWKWKYNHGGVFPSSMVQHNASLYHAYTRD